MKTTNTIIQENNKDNEGNEDSKKNKNSFYKGPFDRGGKRARWWIRFPIDSGAFQTSLDK